MFRRWVRPAGEIFDNSEIGRRCEITCGEAARQHGGDSHHDAATHQKIAHRAASNPGDKVRDLYAEDGFNHAAIPSMHGKLDADAGHLFRRYGYFRQITSMMPAAMIGAPHSIIWCK